MPQAGKLGNRFSGHIVYTSDYPQQDRLTWNAA